MRLEGLLEDGRDGWLLIVDLDRFKRVNDRYGHSAGDAVLKEVTRAMRHRLRRDDAVARIGGDEFAILLSGATSRPALIADAIIQLVEGMQVAFDARPGAQRERRRHGFPPGAGGNLEALLGAADRSMYRAKSARQAAAAG